MNIHKATGWGALPLVISLLSVSPGMQCGQPTGKKPGKPDRTGQTTQTAPPSNPVPQPSGTTNADLPFFGFNTKGAMDPGEQIQYANAYLDKITSPEIKQRLVIRVTGGTISQTTYGKDWTPEVIRQWTDLQKRQGVRFIYVVNGNDAPAEQAAAIQRWMDAGARFDFLEMMNEYYLPKFVSGDRSHAEVTRQVTPEDYVNSILPAYWKELDRFHLPYYLIFAPSRPGRDGAQQKMDEWNTVVSGAIRNKYPDKDLNATIHLYARGSLAGFDYGQIDRLRQSLPPGRHIAVTEAGILDNALSYEQAGNLAVEHYRNIMAHLGKGDYLLDQVLYNMNKRGNIAALNPHTGGETPKGRVMLQFIQGGLR